MDELSQPISSPQTILSLISIKFVFANKILLTLDSPCTLLVELKKNQIHLLKNHGKCSYSLHFWNDFSEQMWFILNALLDLTSVYIFILKVIDLL